MRAGMLLVALICLGAAGPIEAPAERSFAIEGAGTITIPVPGGWRTEASERPNADLTVRFIAPSGESFLVSAFRNRTGDPEYNAGPRVREMIERSGKKQLEGAVETELKVLELHGSSRTGYYYSLTDRSLVGKTPPPDEYRVMTHGGLGVGDLLLSFTVLSQERDTSAVREALDALKAATFRPAAER